MSSSLQLRATKSPFWPSSKNLFTGDNTGDGRRRLLCRRRPALPFISLILQSHSNAAAPSTSEPSHSHYTSPVGPSPISSRHPSHWNLTHRHIILLNVVTLQTAISTTWLFCSAIPTLLAFKRAAESLEKLWDGTREELPDTMAAIRLSGMEINDLTSELSDLGQGITQGVRSSTLAVRLAEGGLQGFTSMASSASLQEVEPVGPGVAKTARGLREGLVQGRTILHMFFTLAHFSKFVLNYITGRRKSQGQRRC